MVEVPKGTSAVARDLQRARPWLRSLLSSRCAGFIALLVVIWVRIDRARKLRELFSFVRKALRSSSSSSSVLEAAAAALKKAYRRKVSIVAKTQRVKSPGAGEVGPLPVSKGPAVSEIEEEEEAKQEDSDLDESDVDRRYEDGDEEEDEESYRERTLIAPPQEIGLLARISELCSLFLAKYMDAYEPVAYNTRSRQRKRKGSLVKGLKTPARKPRTAWTKSKASARAVIAADELADFSKENVLAVSNNNALPDGVSSAAAEGGKRSKRSSRPRSGPLATCNDISSNKKNLEATTGANVGMDARAQGSAAPLEDSNATAGSDTRPSTSSSTASSSTTTPAAETSAGAKHDSGDEVPYIAEVPEPAELTALESDAEAAAQGARLAELLESEDWIDQHEATTLLRRLVTFHSKETDLYVVPRLEQVLFFLKQGVESLRSAQSRNALYAIEACFHSLKMRLVLGKETMQAVIDPIIKKSVNDKRFIAAAGESVLDEMVTSAATASVLQALLAHSSSRSAKVCSVVSKYATRCLRNLVKAHKAQGPGGQRGESPLDSAELAQALVISFAELESSRSVDAKKPAQESLRVLHGALRKDRFEEIATAALSAADASRVLGIVQRPVQRNAKKPSLKELMASKRREMLKQQQTANGSARAGAAGPGATLVLEPAVASSSSSTSDRSRGAE